MAHKRFVLFYLLFTLLMGLPFLTNFLFILRAGENLSIKEIVHRQRERDYLYGTAFNDVEYAYKLELVRTVKPRIVVLGSSRVLHFREEYFSVPFVNCGRVVPNIQAGKEFLEKMLSVHKPEVILLGLDFWWFRYDSNRQREGHADFRDTGTTTTFSKLTAPFRYLRDGKLSALDYAGVILSGAHASNPLARMGGIGLDGILRSTGFRKDGSYFHGKIYMGVEPRDVGFSNTLHRIRTGTDRFEYGSSLDDARLEALDDMLALCRENNVRIILFIPPLAGAVLDEMNGLGDKYAYLDALYAHLRNRGDGFFNFQDAFRAVGSPDCEFMDGFHGGEVTTQRILTAMAQTDETLRSMVDLEAMAASIESNAGHALALFDPDIYKARETDFLELGCSK